MKQFTEELSAIRRTHLRKFCPEGLKPYRALNKTLTELPGGVPLSLLCAPYLSVPCLNNYGNSEDQFSSRRTREISIVVGYLDDYPEAHQGNLVGLADRAIRWHRQEQEEVQRRMLERLGPTTPTARPPVPLPELPGVHFLATVGEVVDEGQRMQHCIASYAEKAVMGWCYLFHVDFEGAEASVAVHPQGGVLQAQGPKNSRNAATVYGERILSAWGRQF
jgi:hypothetical protein